MNPEDFRSSPSGQIASTINGQFGFVPNPLPPNLDLRPHVPLLQEAAMALGELNGIGRALPNPYVLIRPIQRREAVASSNIEGTVTSLSDLLLLEEGAAERERPADTREVLNYVRALEKGIARLDELPLCLRIIREIHETLLSGVQKHRGSRITPGEFRREQNWIGGSKIEDARFIPPPPNHMIECLDSFEKFLQSDPTIETPPIVKAALLHYQFETIHPFPDGNGRVGRLLIPLFLTEKKVLSQPILYMSAYFERHRDEYIDRMYKVSLEGAWSGWISFFVRGVMDSCNDTIGRARQLQDLQNEYRQRIQHARASALLPRLVDLIFERPVITVRAAQEALGVTYRSAQLNVEKLVKEGILTEAISDRPKFYAAYQVLDIVHDA